MYICNPPSQQTGNVSKLSLYNHQYISHSAARSCGVFLFFYGWDCWAGVAVVAEVQLKWLANNVCVSMREVGLGICVSIDFLKMNPAQHLINITGQALSKCLA